MTHLSRLTSVLPARKVDQGLHICRRYRTIYVQNPKAACSTIKLALQRAERADPGYEPETNIHDKPRSPLASPSDLSAEEFQALLRDGVVFSFVRNPFDRVLSAYANKIVRPQKRGRFRERAGFAANDCPSFERFVDALATQDPAQFDPHWRPQTINLLFDDLTYHRIGRVETFDADWAQLAAETGLPQTYERRGLKEEKPPLAEAYTPRLARRVLDIFRRDFEAFGYPGRPGEPV